ncbi:MAG: hypothetical protein GX050_05170 [Firmicutes bacterium]|nr:hypothetical protein [Bacillota bacterium]
MVKRGVTIVFIFLLGFSLCFPVPTVEGSTAIPLTIKERAGLDWKSTPITVGVPVPAQAESFTVPPRVIDQWGKEVPSQAVLLGDETPGVIPRWWRITFLGSINKNDLLNYRVVPGREQRVQPNYPVTVHPLANGYFIENGWLRLELKADEPLLSKVWFDPNGRGAFAEETPVIASPVFIGVKTEQGIYDTSSVSSATIRITEEGPVRVVVRLRGELGQAERADRISYDCRLLIFAESPYLSMEINFANQTGNSAYLEEAWLKFRSLPDEENYQLTFGTGGKTPLSATLKAADSAQVLVDKTGRVQWGGILAAHSPRQEANPAALGWADLTGRRCGLSVGIKAFRQQYPKGMKVNGDGEFIIQLVPASSQIPWTQGMSKTHHLTFCFHGNRERNWADYVAALTNAPPIAVASADWFNQTGALSQPLLTAEFLSGLTSELMPTAMLLKEKNWSDLLNLYGPPDYGAAINPEHWGFFNYGDLQVAFSAPWAQPGVYWNNNAYDLLYQLLVAYLQTGDHTFVEIAEAALTHYQDVDLVSPSTNTRPFPGLNHVQAAQTGKPVEADDFRYLANRGLLLGYYLLDDDRGGELALRMADRVCLQDGINLEEPRTLSLSLHAVLTGYRATGSSIYLERAGEIASTILNWQKQHNGGFPSDFIYKSGLVADALVEYYRLRKDPEVLAGIKRAVDYAIYHFWEEETGFIQNPGGLLFSSALQLLSAETGEEKYLQIGLTQLKTFLAQGSLTDPKTVALYYRTLPSLLQGVR